MDNGDAWSLEPFEKTESTFFNGHILIIVQAGTQKGVCELEISAEGFDARRISLNLE